MTEEREKFKALFLLDCERLGIPIPFGIKEFYINEPTRLGFGHKLLVVFETEEEMNYYRLSGTFPEMENKEVEFIVQYPGIETQFSV